MYYGDEKNKEMIRSILPSKRMKGAREDKKILNKKLRAKAKAALHNIYDEESWDDSSFDFWDDGQHERSWIVRDRRDADKLAHFMRWAEHKAKDIPDGEKMGYIKGILPGKGVIFDHACFHLEGLDGFDSNELHGWRAYWRRRQREVINREDLILLLKKVCEVRKFQIALNDAIRKHHKTTIWEEILDVKKRKNYIERYDYDLGKRVRTGGFTEEIEYVTKSIDLTIGPRLLMGMLDVEDFVDDIIFASEVGPAYFAPGYRGMVSTKKRWFRGEYFFEEELHYDYCPNPDHHPEWLRVVKFFVEDFIEDPKKAKNFNILVERKREIYNWRLETVVETTEMVNRSFSYDWKL